MLKPKCPFTNDDDKFFGQFNPGPCSRSSDFSRGELSSSYCKFSDLEFDACRAKHACQTCSKNISKQYQAGIKNFFLQLFSKH